jgi:hypothetical protein
MDILSVYFPHFSEDQLQQAVAVSSPNVDLPALNTEIMSLSDVYFTIDPVTDNIENPVNKLLSSTLSPLERDKIMAFLQPLPRSKRHNLSDEDLVNMLPSRYNTTLTDMDAVRDFFENNILNEVDAQDVDQGQQGQQAQQAQQGE